MRITVIGDIQGKLENLEAFYRQLNGHDPRNVYVLGDVLQYGTKMEDNLCVDLVRDKGSQMVLGNHEGFAMMRYFTRSSLKPKIGVIDLDEDMFKQSIEYFETLPEEIKMDNLLFTHAIPDDRLKIKTLEDAKQGFDFLDREHPDITACFVGHSHTPTTFCKEGNKYWAETRTEFPLVHGVKYIINPGALEDGNFLVYDTEQPVVQRKTL